MRITSFHHPDISFPVIRRRITIELLELTVQYAQFLATTGRSLNWNRTFPNQTAYYCAQYRLKKNGFLAYRDNRGGPPVLHPTAAAEHKISPFCRRRPPWPTQWNGIWYILMFDVPETRRSYRETLRSFLKRMHMGCLQRSVYVTPRDVRPAFKDLVDAAAVDEYAYLFEAHTVLGMGHRDMVQSAWDFDRLEELQRFFCTVCDENIRQIRTDKSLSRDNILAIAREELTAFLSAMELDPVLPKPLWPAGYLGQKAWKQHRMFVREVVKRL